MAERAFPPAELAAYSSHRSKQEEYFRCQLNAQREFLPDDPVDEAEVPALIRCEDRGVRGTVVVLIGVFPVRLGEMIIQALSLSGVPFAAKRMEWIPREWNDDDHASMLAGGGGGDDCTPMKLYDTRKKAAVETWADEKERRWAYETRWFNRECGERWSAVQDQHCRVRELKEQHRRSLQPHYTNSRRAGKENARCQQPRTGGGDYKRRNQMRFNNASVYRPKRKT